MERVTQRLCVKFPSMDADLVTWVVREAQNHFATHPNRDFVPILVEEVAKDVLSVMPSSRSR